MARNNAGIYVKETSMEDYTIYGSQLDKISSDIIDFYKCNNAIHKIWDNPNIYNGSGKAGGEQPLNETVPTNLRTHQQVADGSEPSRLSRSRQVSASDTNKLVSDLNNLKNRMNSWLGVSIGAASGVKAGDAIQMSTYVAISNILGTMQSALSKYQNWWRSGVCGRSCQIACQVGCQIACQGCVGSNCHDQHCGCCT